MSKLVLILCSPRTGSSIVSQIFWRHGCWVSKQTAKYVNQFGYTTYEDRSIRTVVNRQWTGIATKPKPEREIGAPIIPSKKHLADIKTIVNKTIPNNIDFWMFKTSAQSYPLFIQFDPIFIFIKRDEEQSVQSLYDKSLAREQHKLKDEIREIHRQRMNLMSDIKEEYGGEWVDTDELIDGNYKSIQHAVEYCGLEYDPELVDASLDKKKWHYKNE